MSKEEIRAENIKRGLVKLSIIQKASKLVKNVVSPIKNFVSEWFHITESNLLNTGIYLNVSMIVFITILLATGVIVFA